MKTFKDWNDECPKCGDGCQVLTSAPNGYAHDGDLVQCNDCGLEGSVVCDGDENDNGDTIASTSWNDFDDEDLTPQS